MNSNQPFRSLNERSRGHTRNRYGNYSFGSRGNFSNRRFQSLSPFHGFVPRPTLSGSYRYQNSEQPFESTSDQTFGTHMNCYPPPNMSFPPPPSFYGTNPRLPGRFFNQYAVQRAPSFREFGQAASSFQVQQRALSTSPSPGSLDEKGPSQNQWVDNNASAPILISSEESDIEEITLPAPTPKVVPGLSLSGREWEDVSFENNTKAKEPVDFVDFSMMSYNILSQKLLLENSYLYRTCPQSELEEDRRVERIIGDITEVLPDVICLQEVESKLFFEKLKPHFEPLGYTCLYKKRTGYKPDGCAILISSKKFAIDSYHEVEFYEPEVDLLDRDNVAIVAVVDVKTTPSSFLDKKTRVAETPGRLVIANTHLLFNHRRGDIKLAQLQYLLADIDRRALFGVDTSSGPHRLLVYYPVLLCGDLNLEPYSPLYNFITEGFLKFEGMPRSLMSGQTNLSAGPVMSRTLLPDSFGLADNSEFAESCTLKNSMNSCVHSITGGPVVADVKKDITLQMNSNDTSQVRKYYSGVASHPFLLRPVYQYDTEGRGDFTSLTRGNRHTVDHIFYSVVRSQTADSNCNASPQREGRLHLLRRLRVPTSEVINNGSIPYPAPSLPTHGVPSDHVPLLAQFRFEIPRQTISEVPLTN